MRTGMWIEYEDGFQSLFSWNLPSDPKGRVYQNGEVNNLFLAYRRGYSLGLGAREL